MTLLTPVAAVIPPATLTLATPAGATNNSDTVAWQPGLALLVHNPTGGALNLTIGTPVALDKYGVAVGDVVTSIPAGTLRLVQLPQDLQDNTGLVGFGAGAGIVYRPVVL